MTYIDPFYSVLAVCITLVIITGAIVGSVMYTEKKDSEGGEK